MPWTDEELEILKLTPEEQLAYNKYMAEKLKKKSKRKSKNKRSKKSRKKNRRK